MKVGQQLTACRILSHEILTHYCDGEIPLLDNVKDQIPSLYGDEGLLAFMTKKNAGPRWLPERLVKTVILSVYRMEQSSPPETNLISFPDPAPNEDIPDPTPDPVANQNDHQPSPASTQTS